MTCPKIIALKLNYNSYDSENDVWVNTKVSCFDFLLINEFSYCWTHNVNLLIDY